MKVYVQVPVTGREWKEALREAEEGQGKHFIPAEEVFADEPSFFIVGIPEFRDSVRADHQRFSVLVQIGVSRLESALIVVRLPAGDAVAVETGLAVCVGKHSLDNASSGIDFFAESGHPGMHPLSGVERDAPLLKYHVSGA